MNNNHLPVWHKVRLDERKLIIICRLARELLGEFDRDWKYERFFSGECEIRVRSPDDLKFLIACALWDPDLAELASHEELLKALNANSIDWN